MITFSMRHGYIIYLVLFFLWSLFPFYKIYADDIEDECKKLCDREVSKGGEDLFCNTGCKTFQCHWGCDNYEKALNSSCHRLCSDQQATQRQFCTRGCTTALQSYSQHIQEEIGPLQAPELKTGQKGHSYAVLQWNGNILPNATYYVQSRLMDINGNWNINNALWDEGTGDINVTDLQPYVTYKVLIVISASSFVSSPETEPITTLSKGAPSASPTILEISAPTPTVITVSWAAPIFINGPLLGYRLLLEPVNHPALHPAMREVQANVTSWTFRQLQPSQYYVLSVSAWNRDGEGKADIANITTPNPGNLTAEEMPYLILAEDNKVLKQNMKDLFTTPYPLEKIQPNNTLVRGAEVLYEGPVTANLTGIGVHVGRQLLLVSDSDGHVRLVNVTWRDSAVETCSGLAEPGALTIDWLNNVAYVVDGLYIYHCDFDGNKVTKITGTLPTSPRDIKVDPINGYLYFTQGSPNTGIYRIDLGTIHPDYSVPFQQVVKSQLKTFSVDYNNLQLYFPNETQNTMMSSFLDGTGQIDLRKSKVVRPNYFGIVSMVHYDGLFYWTNGSRVLKEDYDISNGTFYHNPLLFFDHHYLAFNTYQQSVQPKPVPHSSPQNIQALFAADKVYIQWREPKTLSFQGKGAWKKWEYDVLILENDGSQNQVIQRVKVNEAEISNLVHDTSYVVKVRARSEDKVGPWSSPFIGRTLSTEAATASVVVAKGGFTTTVSEVDMYGDKIQSLTRILGEVKDMAWTKDLVIMATVDEVYTYNRVTGRQNGLAIQAVSVAYDWLGKKLYWSSPNLGVIRRSDLSLSNVEFVTQGLARRIAIDAVNGRLYWATIRTVESCFLNGEDHVKYFSVPFFSGKHVISITLNFDIKKILWYVRGFDLQELYISDLIEGSTNGEAPQSQLVGNFNSISDSSNLQYYAHRIFWQNQEGAVTVGDLDVNHTSVITQPGVIDFTVYHPSMHPYPAGLDGNTVKVVPDPVDSNSVRCVGTWEKFNLTWDKASVNHGMVHYEVSVQFNDKIHMMQTVNNWYEMTGVLPYSHIKVTVRAHTFWGYSDATMVDVYSPMSVPSAPLTPRVYVTQQKDSATAENSLAADFRWSAPETSNGIIVRYIVYFRYRNNGTKITRPPTSRHYIQKYLEPSVTYSFQVQACTDIGCGNLSDTVSARADAVNPVPKLLIATANGLQLADVDSDNDNSVTMETDIEPKTLAFLAQDDRMFWTNEDNELYESCKKDSNSPMRKKLLSVNGTVQDIAIDWISRTIYLVVSHNSGTSSSIVAYLMDQEIHQMVENRPQIMSTVAVEPYTSSIYWTEVEPGTTVNKIYRLTNNNEAQLLSMHRIKRAVDSTCNCSQVSFGKVITTDHSKSGQMEILVYDSQSKAIIATDSASCNCRTVVSQSEGFPPDKLSVDHLNIYWYNKQNNSLYVYEKATKMIRKQSVPGLTDMVAYGAHLQPLPSSECLDPGAYSKSLRSSLQTNLSLTVLMESVTWPSLCQGISRPATKYTLYYKPMELTGGACDLKTQECLNQTSYDNEVVLSGLRPYTEYIVQGAVSNYYTEYLSEALSQPVVFRTAVGVPSAVTDIKLEVMTNKRITVKWNPPTEMNGPRTGLRYLIKYSTQVDNARIEGFVNSSQIKAWSTLDLDCPLQMCITIMNLLPGHIYNIQILVSNMDELHYSTSKVVSATTFMTPGPPLVTAFTHSSMNISWEKTPDNSTHSILFYIKKVDGSSEGSEKDNLENSGFDVIDSRTIYNCTFSGLKPFTEYQAYVRVNFISGDTVDGPYKIYRTKAYVPGTPNPPVVEHLTSISGHEVLWEVPNENGEKILNYMLEYRKKGEKKWVQIYNGSDTRWLVDEKTLPPNYSYMFRVAAENSIGWGEFSTNSSWFYYLIEETTDDLNIAAVAAITAILLVLVIVVIMVVWCVLRRRKDVKKKPTQFIAVARGPDMELATLRELPHTAVQQSNTLYAINFIMPTDADIAALPHFMRDQLTLTKFLGSGAFGEVFEGVARNILSDSSGETKVAVKTLRKSASDQEKEEFLKEALLMSNFKHQHILSLLGVCLDNDPQFIILELMEGGDLLSFLRGCRPSQANPVYLSMADLIKICVHVARGCKYLEEMHFVHRDLAARNCLVSSKNPAEFRVKIGDFGLARDIYKNDYYRKEGEGLLPVRWMSPESLVDGVFTTQSDIWAFGVLMWEVITFGQQPYPARTNIEVLHFVRSGGQLDKPDSCPQEIFFLMKKCWSSNTEDRPSFSLILHTLEEFHQKCIALLSDYITPIRSRQAQGSEGGERQTAANRNSWRSRGDVHPSSVNKVNRDDRDFRRRKITRNYESVTSLGSERLSVPVQVTPSRPINNLPDTLDDNAADGCDREVAVKQKRRGKARTSSLGHENKNTIRQCEPEVLYRKIHRATSFDSPEPRTETCSGYLCPKTTGAPTYLDLISDPSDPPPPPSVHHKSRSLKPSLSSRHTSVSSCPMSISSRNSSCSSDPFYHPMDSNLMVNLPAYPADKSTDLYQQIHSIDSPSGGCEVPYATVSRSIPEEKDDVFEDNYKTMELPNGYDYVPGQLKSVTNNRYSNGYSVIDSSKRQSNKNRGALKQESYLVVETPSRHELLAASSSDDVKMSQISLYNACNESKDDVTSVNSSYISYDPASLPRRTKADRQNGNAPSHSAEMYVRYGDQSVNCERPYNSAEARLVYSDQTQREKHNNIHNRKHVLAVNDSNYVDCNKSRSFLSLSSLTGDSSLLTYTGIHPAKNVIIDTGQLPMVHGLDNSRSSRGSKAQVYPVNNTSPKQGYPATDEGQVSLV